jgi:hypothetical protein
MKTPLFTSKYFLPVLTTILCLQASTIFQSCKKSVEPSANEEIATKKRPQNPPPPPPPFYFSNCNIPTNSATFQAGVPTNTTITKNYVNSPGGSYDAFTTTVNGITISAPAGTFNVGSGSVVFTATGTPISTGFLNVWIGVGNIQQCMMFITVTNAPVSGPTVDPGPEFGSTGIINFIYKGQPVAYKTVRAKDGKIWLQQKPGFPASCISHKRSGFLWRLFSMGTLG